MLARLIDLLMGPSTSSPMTGGAVQSGGVVLVIGSGPDALRARDWDVAPFDQILAINNAWRIRPDWTHVIHPEDFAPERRPTAISKAQQVIAAQDYVSAQNAYGGFVYGGGTMAFTAGYWALHALLPRILAFVGCNMVYPTQGATHFYGTGNADPLRDDPTLQSLEAKSARLFLTAARQGTCCVNLSGQESRLVFPRVDMADLAGLAPPKPVTGQDAAALRREADLGYFVPSGRYWLEQDRFDKRALRDLDDLWLQAFAAYRAMP